MHTSINDSSAVGIIGIDSRPKMNSCVGNPEIDSAAPVVCSTDDNKFVTVNNQSFVNGGLEVLESDQEVLLKKTGHVSRGPIEESKSIVNFLSKYNGVRDAEFYRLILDNLLLDEMLAKQRAKRTLWAK